MAPNPRCYNSLQRIITRALNAASRDMSGPDPLVGATPEMYVFDALMKHQDVLEHALKKDAYPHSIQCKGCLGCDQSNQVWWL